MPLWPMALTVCLRFRYSVLAINLSPMAKKLVSEDPEGAAIDMPAGPSEVLVIADANADCALVANLLSQAEHRP